MVNTTSKWDAADYARNAAFVPALGMPAVELLDPRPGERILDLGCGDGVLTEALVRAGAEVVGVDASPDMIAAAKARGIDAYVKDGQALDFDGAFDAAFSNAALHWMLDPAAVAAGVFRALKPGARFVGEQGGHGNIAQLRAGLRAELTDRGYPVPAEDPQWYPTPEEFTRIYSDAGFTDIEAWLIQRPTPLPAGAASWFRTFRAGFLDAADVPEEAQEEVAMAAEARVAPILRQPDGNWVADYVRLRFTMRKPL
ncbi:trans-aconitate 2-methyltransferase [Sphingomonas sp. LaA6.9]|uniref:class I SAM-dependent methyltransferase n=1 Tax=Sphingomonas sp. LaA6.9 TaxID=2919914 RepID=UPI001F4F3943|nr:class I SAM-dependent methyltransferase [Sphingomonas sp. LaA6.9]MCJ8155943.1 class I SAM-dependent methyltransferase [Sphingomonas sp. LaA6.9]